MSYNPRVSAHDAASDKYPMKQAKKADETKLLNQINLWDIPEEAPKADTTSSLFGNVSKEPIPVDFGTSFMQSIEPPKEEVPKIEVPLQETPPTTAEKPKPKEMVATCDFDTHPDSCDVEVPRVETSIYCDFDTHPESCDQEPIQAQNLYTPIKKGDNLGKYAKALYGSASDPEILKAIAEPNPKAVKTVETPAGKKEYRLHFDPKKETELVLPYVITKKDGTTIATNEAFLPES